MFVLPLGLVVDAALRVHGGVLASTPVLWIAVQVESGALDSNGESLFERTRLLVRIKIRGLFYRYGRQNRDLTTYRMSILASEGIEPLFRLKRRAHLERPRAPGAMRRWNSVLHSAISANTDVQNSKLRYDLRSATRVRTSPRDIPD